ncbi:MAG: VCBS repeat-containing protein [Acidobacteriota bacterium]
MRNRALLLVLMLCLFPWCGSSKPKGGLIVARSVFKEGPSPATMLILRPGAEGWSREEVSVPPGKVVLQPGIGADGKSYVRRLGKEGEPPSKPLTFVRSGAGWTVAEAPGASEKDITWAEVNGKPESKVFELEGGNVFHKCMWFKPAFGEPGILTISANMPYLQIWREPGGSGTGFKAETLWTAVVGQREHRFRDVEAGDVDSDGQDELVVVTHDLGAVFVIEQTPQGMKPQEIYRDTQRTFTHEVEIGDVDGDKKLEFFTTPSAPNRLDGTPQGGRIDMYRWDGGSKTYVRTEVSRLPERHPKEILAVDLDGDGRVELYAAIETAGMKDPSQRLFIRGWAWKDGGMKEIGDVTLQGDMCRFLNTGDTDCDGAREIIASTRKNGIYVIQRKGGSWSVADVVPGSVSSGFEHATVVFDWDGDGRDDIFVASDDQKKLRHFWLPKGQTTYQSEDIMDFQAEKYFIWNVMPLPPGK